MKKLLIISLIVFSSSAFSEAYFCQYAFTDSISFKNIFTRGEADVFIKTSNEGEKDLMKIVKEDSRGLYLMGSFSGGRPGSTVVTIDKVTGEMGTLYLRAILDESSQVFYGDCLKQ